LTDLHEIWLGNAHWPSEWYGQLKFQTFKNLKWWTAASFEKSIYGDLREIWNDDAHWLPEGYGQLKFRTFNF